MDNFVAQHNIGEKSLFVSKNRFCNSPRRAGIAHSIEMQHGYAKFDELFTLIDHPFNAGIFYVFFGFAAVDQVEKVVWHIDMERFCKVYQLL